MTDLDGDAGLTTDERQRLAAIRAAACLDELVALTDATSVDDAYFAAKAEWFTLRNRALESVSTIGGLPGRAVEIDGHRFAVHGVTHADTTAEREHLREHVRDLLDAGASVYCEQGIRPMYFADLEGVCEMDDLRWAAAEAAALDEAGGGETVVAELVDNAGAVADELRELAFATIDSGRDVYGDEFATALGDVATSFLTGPTDRSTAVDFESFVRSSRASREPETLAQLQHYYECRLLPQPLERAWLRRHDPELELFTHARNARMADSLVYHNDRAERVHAIVGAAHQPGVVHYLERIADGSRSADGFEPTS